MNEFGEPNMGNPSVRFDEGRERVGHWPWAFQPILSRLLYNRQPRQPPAQRNTPQRHGGATFPQQPPGQSAYFGNPLRQ